MPTTTFLEPGTDATQDFSLWQVAFIGGDAALTSATDQAFTGTHSIKAVGTAAANAYLASPDGVCADAGTAISVRARFSTVTPADLQYFMGAETAGDGSSVITIVLNANGTIGINAPGATEVSGSTVLSINTWYRFTLAYVITAANNWSAKAYINGVLEASSDNTQGTLSNTGTSDLIIGAVDVTTHSAITVWLDDIYVDNRTDKSDPGDIRVTAKRPVSNGTTNGFTTQIGAGGSGYGTGHSPQVNEQPLSQTNGWSFSVVGSAITEEYNVEGRSVGDVDLTGATIVDWGGWVFAKAGTSETASIVVGGSTSNISLTTTATGFFKAKGSSTYPAGSGTDIGIVSATTTTLVSLYECGVLVAYTPAVDAQEWLVRSAAQQGPRVRNVMYR